MLLASLNEDVVRETEYYTWRCTVDGCYATNGSFTEEVESHGSCGK